MIDVLRVVRYFIFFVFVISNAITTSVAVWNLSIVESEPLYATLKQLDIYLIVLGSTGLCLIFPIIFFEIYGKVVFLGRVWFELLWVGVYGIMELVGASILTSQSTSQVCTGSYGVRDGLTAQSDLEESPCKSIQVLQAFTWTPAILLLGYLALLLILSCFRTDENPKVWFACVRSYPWIGGGKTLRSTPTSPVESTGVKSMFRSRTPVIYAPKPQRVAAPILAYRSGLSSEYEIEHFKPSGAEAPTAGPSNVDQLLPPIPAAAPIESSLLLRPLPQQPEHMPQPVFSTPFYHSSVQRVIEKQPSAPQPPPEAQLGQIRRLPASPPPLGDWPRLDATSQPRTKRKPLPIPQADPIPYDQPSTSLPPPPRQSGQYTRPLPPTSSRDATSSMALTTVASQSRRSRPGGPRIRTSSDDDSPNRRIPPPLDLSNISSYRSAGFR